MIVLGIDTGMATLGWARFDTIARRFESFGAFETEKQDHKHKTDDQDDRIEIVADVLALVLPGVELVVAERRSFASAASIGPISLCFGVVVGLVSATSPRPRLYTAKPQHWQRAVQPHAGKKVDYDAVEATVTQYVRSDPGSSLTLDCVKPDLRNHALDACAIALMGAYRLHECRPIGGRNTSES